MNFYGLRRFGLGLSFRKLAKLWKGFLQTRANAISRSESGFNEIVSSPALVSGMSFTVFITGVLVFYFVLWFFDSFFKSCMHYPYYAFLEGTGLKVGILNLSWKTTAFNRLLFRWGKKGTNFLQKWYTFGYLFSIFLFLPFAIWVLTSTVTSYVWGTEKSLGAEIQTVIPGVNIPTSDIWAYILALAVSSVFHELGHAIAAVQEDVQLLRVGFYVFVIIPIAFVELNTDQLNSISVTRRLKIFCAGVWHNIACGCLAFLLFFTVSSVFKIGYYTGHGVIVTKFKALSPLIGNRGLSVGDQVTAINNCKVRDNEDWYTCIFASSSERFGLCVTSEFILNNDEVMAVSYKDNDQVNCCLPENRHSLCFEYIESQQSERNLPVQYSCLKPREIINEQFVTCLNTQEHTCPDDQHCLKPLLGNQTHLFVIQLLKKESVLYIGTPYDLLYTVFVDHYIPKHALFSFFSPQLIEKILEYIFMFSMGIGIVNIIPCFGTDGHHIASNVVQWIAMCYKLDKDLVNVVTFSLVGFGTITTIPALTYLFIKTVMM